MTSLDVAPGYAATGIPGADAAMGGGLPRGRATLVVGPPGAGKTVFGLQFLANNGGGVWVALEEPPPDLKANVRAFEWAGRGLDNVTFIDVGESLPSMDSSVFDIGGLLAAIDAEVAENEADRVVIDGLDGLLTMLSDVALARRELHRLYRWVRAREVTTVLTSKAGSVPGNAAELGLDHISDCVVKFEQRMVEGVSQRSLVVRKHRGACCTTSELPMTIGSSGIFVATPRDTEFALAASTERVSTGVAALDDMLEGGYFRSSAILVSGMSGTSKTTLAGAFVDTCCRRGERVVFVSFDDGPAQIVRNLRSVGIDLQPHVDSGRLHIHGFRARSQDVANHYLSIAELIDNVQPAAVVLDSVSALMKAGDERLAGDAAHRLLEHVKASGVTALFTTLTSDKVYDEHTPLHISTIADAWIHLSYEIQNGERNRALTIIKARGTGHSNQVREFVLSRNGIDLLDVYVSEGKVLMGSARLEAEEAERHAEARRVEAYRNRERELLAELDRLREQQAALSRQIGWSEQTLANLREAEEERVRARSNRHARIHAGRMGRDGQSKNG